MLKPNQKQMQPIQNGNNNNFDLARQQQKKNYVLDPQKEKLKNEIIQQGQEPLECYTALIDCCGGFLGTLYNYLPCFLCFCIKQSPYVQVETGNIGLLTKFGKYQKQLAPGTYFVNPYTEKLSVISSMLQTVNLSSQVVLTKDNIQATIDASVNYKILDALISEYTIYDTDQNVIHLCYSILREVAGNYVLQDLLEKKDEVRVEMMKNCDKQLMHWGIHIENVYIKDIIVNQQLQQALSVVAQETRYAQAKIISAKADVESAKLLREAADALSSKSAMQIRYLQTLAKVCEDKKAKIIFYPKAKK